MDKSFMGRGWAFPPTFIKNPCIALTVEAEEDIRESLHILLQTRLRERVMQSNYGCNLDMLLFESITTTFLSFVKDHVSSSIRLYEPRVNLLQVTMDTTNLFSGMILIRIDFEVRATNRRDNIVYPFYLNEGTHVDVASFPAENVG
jgi:uncharacterized protein